MINVNVLISSKLNIEVWQVENVIQLMSEGATIPFIARYRKERTGSLTDLKLLELEQVYKQIIALNERREVILKSLEEQQVNEAGLIAKIKAADSLTQLEDLYLPYKPKRKTKALIARQRGLEPLAKMIMSEHVDQLDLLARRFVNEKHEIHSVEEALEGARHIIAEWVSEKEWIRKSIRSLFVREGRVYSKAVKEKEEAGIKYRDFFDKEDRIMRVPSHRILAMFRGESEGFLQLKVHPDKTHAFEKINERITGGKGEAAAQKSMAVEDALKRLLFPSMETETRAMVKQKADEEAIAVFADNLRQLLLAPPLGGMNTLAIDPGFRSGCKVVCLDRNGKLMHNETIFPHPPQGEAAMSVKKLKSLISAYHIEAIAIGNGTAGRETEELIKRAHLNRGLLVVMVNESGASVYSASAIAREEFPDYDVTVRGAVSIGRRLMDPLAELVKIDPKSIGVGQYQHDVNQKMLQDRLQTEVAFCVNNVGVELNTSSKELLTFVSGIGPKLAEQIIIHRNKYGAFSSRKELLKVKGLGDKAFQQSAGFLRIKDGSNPLDASAVHPENYELVNHMAATAGLTVKELIGNKKVKELIKPEDFVTELVGLPTIRDILDELEKPGRDPRKNFTAFEFDKNIKHIEDLRPDMILPAIVNNITAFGAFVDLGIHESGLIHKSQIAEAFVQNPSDYLSLNQSLMVKVLEVDVARKRISLTLRGVDQ